MIFWIVLNSFLSIAVALVIAIKLHYFSDKCHWVERVGMGLVGVGMVLNIAPILAKAGFPFGNGAPTPFDDWASALLRAGLFIYFFTRCCLHFFNNAEMKNKARRRLREAGIKI